MPTNHDVAVNLAAVAPLVDTPLLVHHKVVADVAPAARDGVEVVDRTHRGGGVGDVVGAGGVVDEDFARDDVLAGPDFIAVGVEPQGFIRAPFGA